LFRLVLESHTGRAPCAESEEKHEPVSDIDTVLVDSLKALDPNRPIREADIQTGGTVCIFLYTFYESLRRNVPANVYHHVAVFFRIGTKGNRETTQKNKK
jgi:hypothetical protein